MAHEAIGVNAWRMELYVSMLGTRSYMFLSMTHEAVSDNAWHMELYVSIYGP